MAGRTEGDAGSLSQGRGSGERIARTDASRRHVVGRRVILSALRHHDPEQWAILLTAKNVRITEAAAVQGAEKGEPDGQCRVEGDVIAGPTVRPPYGERIASWDGTKLSSACRSSAGSRTNFTWRSTRRLVPVSPAEPMITGTPSLRAAGGISSISWVREASGPAVPSEPSGAGPQSLRPLSRNHIR